MTINCESDVEAVFLKYHKLLGFEEITNIQIAFPDITAIRKRKTVNIELEFIASRIAVHYLFPKSSIAFAYGERLELIDGIWTKFVKNPYAKYFKNMEEVKQECVRGQWDDEGGNVYIVCGKYGARLKRKTLKPWIDIVVCWTACESRRASLEAEGIEVIELKSRLSELGVSW